MNDKGSNIEVVKGRGTPEVFDAMPREGMPASERAEIVLSRLSMPARRAINYWMLSEGELTNFYEFARTNSENSKMKAMLNNEDVKAYIEQEANKGNCMSLVASKDEVEQLLTESIRATGKLESMQELNKMKGYIPKGDGGGVNIQINISGGLDD